MVGVVSRKDTVMNMKKVVLITGASRGIGKAAVLRFASEGFAVAVCDVNEPDFGLPEGSHFYRLDVTDLRAAEGVATQVVADMGSIDVLVSNAGITRDGMLRKMSLDDFKKVIEVNLTGGWIMAKVCAPLMKEGGSIVFVTSCNARGCIGQANYSASKAGLKGLAGALTLELARSGIRVNAVAPGYTMTEMVARIPEEVRRDKIVPQILLGRLGVVEEIADAIFYVGAKATFMNGEEVAVNGGMKLLAA